jgi:hypothetical protein
VPLASRLAQAAEFFEVAYRVGGVEAARELARERRGEQFDPAVSDLIEAEAEVILSSLDAVGTWDAVIAAEPALAIVVSAERFDAALLAVANFVDLKSPYFLGHARAVSKLAAEAGSRLGLADRRSACCAAPASSTTSAGSASRTPCSTSAARSPGATSSASASSRISPSGCCASRRRWRRWRRSPSSIGSGSTARAPARAVRRGHLPAGACARRR